MDQAFFGSSPLPGEAFGLSYLLDEITATALTQPWFWSPPKLLLKVTADQPESFLIADATVGKGLESHIPASV